MAVTEEEESSRGKGISGGGGVEDNGDDACDGGDCSSGNGGSGSGSSGDSYNDDDEDGCGAEATAEAEPMAEAVQPAASLASAAAAKMGHLEVAAVSAAWVVKECQCPAKAPVVSMGWTSGGSGLLRHQS